VVHYGKAIDTAQAAMDRGYDAAGQMLLNARINRATVIARQGDHAQASREAKALAGKALDELVLYNLSCALAQSAVAAAQDTRLAPADRARLQTQYADQAMDYLCQAVSKGWANWRLMENDPDIKPLHARKDFGQLLADVKAKTKQP
jgi:hypothetical protein